MDNTKKQMISASELKKIQLTPDQQLHLISHFEEIANETRVELLRSGFTEKEIENELNKAGSKFKKEFATSFEGLINIFTKNLNDNETDKWQEYNKFYITLHFDKKKFPQGIGYDSIISVEDLTSEQRQEISRGTRDAYSSFEFNFIRLHSKLPTWSANLILEKNDSSLEFITSFPGKIALPVPDPSIQSNSEIKKFKQFWDQHAFIVYK